MSQIGWVIFLCFFPASIGILNPVIWGTALSHQLLALGLLLFSIDQARMAVIDLEQIFETQQLTQDPRLNLFYIVTLITIAVEVVGFYLASIFLGWGIMLVLLSQVWFNACATIQLQPTAKNAIQPRPLSIRVPILLADILGLVLIGLWMSGVAQLGIVLGLWSMAIAYGCAKYFALRTQ